MASEESQIGTTPERVQSRKTFFRFLNPRDWRFSMFNIFHIIRHVCAYVEYFFRHKASAPTPEALEKHLPKADEEELTKLRNPPSEGIQMLWIGHASLLVQIDGLNILFDPVFHDCGPVLFGRLLSGYRRFRPPPVTVESLKKKHGVVIHAVCISHNHYDHLDLRSVQGLVKAYGDSIHWFVPKGMRQWFLNRGCQNIEDLDWWEQRDLSSSCKVGFTPAKHWSLRGIPDYYCRHLWGSWFISGNKGSKFFFAGDTGFVNDTFKIIQETYGAPDVAAIPIGAYKPSPVMRAQHINPREAVKIHVDLGAKHSIGIHWGTFALSNEKIHEPKRDLKDAIETMKEELADNAKEKASLDNFIVLNHGEVRSFSS